MRFKYTILAVCCLALIGCKKDETTADNATPAPAATSTTTTGAPPAAQGDVTGQWSGTAEPGGVKLTYDIKPDTLTQTSESTIPGATKPLATEMEATYKLDGNKMSVKATKMHLTTEDPKTKPDLEKANTALTADFLAKQPAQEWTLEWKDKDNLVITSKSPQGATLTATVKRVDAAGAAPAAGAADAGGSAGGTTTG